jgi:Ion channel.
MENKKFDYVLKLIKKQKGYDNSINIADFWYQNIDYLSDVVDRKWHLYSATFTVLIRWYSEMGIECEKQIKKFISETQKNSQNRKTLININFKNFRFIYNKKEYTLKDFTNRYSSKHYILLTNQDDLMGINLSDIRMQNCWLYNSCFDFADLSNSNIVSSAIDDCSFRNTNFDNSSLLIVQSNNNTTFSNNSIKNTFFNGFDLTKISEPKNLKEVSYFWLVKEFIKRAFNLKIIKNKVNHTEFLYNITKNNSETADIEFISYVNWYLYVTTKIENIGNENMLNKIKFFLALIATKYWQSSFVLIVFSFILNIIYASVNYYNRTGFNRSYGDFFDYFYFSIVTFTTLGFGDITPVNHFNQFLVIFEVITGYTILGVFVFLLSKKISKLF